MSDTHEEPWEALFRDARAQEDAGTFTREVWIQLVRDVRDADPEMLGAAVQMGITPQYDYLQGQRVDEFLTSIA